MLLFAFCQYIVAALPNADIPLSLQAALPAADNRSLSTDAERLNLNTATLEELMELPGIGKATATAILALRDELGTFHYPEDLLLAHGIGMKKLEKIYNLVYTESIR